MSMSETMSMPAPIPVFGFGTYKLKETCYVNVKDFMSLKDKINDEKILIDTASLYSNEKYVGQAIRDSGICRTKMFICTKVQIGEILKGRVGILRDVRSSLRKLGTHIDLLVLHAPTSDDKSLCENWKLLEELYYGEIPEFKGKIMNIGVSNYDIKHLKAILSDCRVKPYSNQIEISPFWTRTSLVDYCEKNKIHVIAHSSLTKGQKFADPTLVDVAQKYKKSPAQILLRWATQRGFTVIPRTTNYEHMVENLNIDFSLDSVDMVRLDNLNETFATHKQYIS
jgi:diketogulonate reductase-like aldo/keto reductase